jgi:hypothetical protein
MYLHSQTKTWCSVFVLGLLLLTYSYAQAKQEVIGLFVQTTDENEDAQKTGALLNWLVREAVQRGETPGLALMDRGMFFSRSQALSAKKWLSQAMNVAEDGYQLYSGNPSTALQNLFRSAQFFEYSTVYALDRTSTRKSLLYLGCLLYRKGDRKLGWQRIAQGILLDPDASPPFDLNAEEQQLVQAVRCNLGQTKLGTLEIKMPKPTGEIYINGVFAGFGSSSFSLPPGNYFITVMHDGSRHWGRRMEVREAQKTTANVFFQRSPNADFYNNFCPTLLKSQQGEQLNDEMKKFAEFLQVQRLWIGCYQPDKGNETSGQIRWMHIRRSGASWDKATTGSVKIGSSLTARWNALNSVLRGVTIQIAQNSPQHLMLYPILRTKGACIDPNVIQLNPLMPTKQEAKSGWLASVGDMIVVYTNYGFRLQGKVLRIEGDILTLQVAETKQPPELQAVRIYRRMVQHHWSLGPIQQRDCRVGERLMIHTIYGFQIQGTVVSANDDTLRIKTRQGLENIPWSIVDKLIRRDR